MEKEETLVTDRNGATGIMVPAAHTKPGVATIRLSSGALVQATSGHLIPQSDGSYRLDGVFSELQVIGQASGSDLPGEVDEEVVPIVEETARVEKRVRETGRVRISKRVQEYTETVDEPLAREEVEVRRVPVNRIVEAPVEIRHEGDTMIVPVLEERLVVQKQLVLKEELHVIRRRSETRKPEDVTLRREEVQIERVEPGAAPDA